ncbi:MAG: O-antigen ligase family protein [Bacteroidales bacterium]|nr:O-antigen ligase family protein [Bacteroidales bacterium]
MKELLPKISFVFLLLIVASLPTFWSLTPLFIALFSISTLAHGFVNNKFCITNKAIVITGISFFLIHLISVFYSEHRDVAWFDIEVKLSLLIFPIMFSVSNKYIDKYRNIVLVVFSASVVIANIYLLIVGMYNAEIIDIWNMDRNVVWRFSSSNLSKYIHPSYLSMYNLFVVVYMVQIIFTSSYKLRLWLILPISFLMVLIVLLQAKAGFLAVGVIVLYIVVLLFIKIKNRLIRYALPLVILFATTYAASQNYRMQIMFSSVVEIIKTGDSKTSSTGVRFEIWKVTTSIIGDNFIFGVGAGDIKPELNKKYAENPEFLEEATDHHLNVHNQYLETWLGEGFIGFGLLMALFIYGIKVALKNKDHLLAMFIIIIMVNFFPEAMLNSLNGVVFFSLFYYFLTLNPARKI